MKTIAKIVLFVAAITLLSAPFLLAGPPTQYVPSYGSLAADPVGACTNGSHYFNTVDGQERCCVAAAWSSCSDPTLSHLQSPTAVNQSLLPGTANAIDLGSAAKAWRATSTVSLSAGDPAGNHVLAGTYTAATSYINAGGSGDRAGLVTFTSDQLIGSGPGLLNGNLADNVASFSSSSVVGKHITFDFLSPKVIQEVKMYQQNATAQGTWQWQGSTNGSTWTSLGATFALGGASATTVTTMAASQDPYRYFRMFGIAGNSSNSPWVHEFEFKLGTQVPQIQSYSDASTPGGTLNLQPAAGTVATGGALTVTGQLSAVGNVLTYSDVLPATDATALTSSYTVQSFVNEALRVADGRAVSTTLVPADNLPITIYTRDGNLYALKCSMPDCSGSMSTSTLATNVAGAAWASYSLKSSRAVLGADGLPFVAYGNATNGIGAVHCLDFSCGTSDRTNAISGVTAAFYSFGNTATSAATLGDGSVGIAYTDYGAEHTLKYVNCVNPTSATPCSVASTPVIVSCKTTGDACDVGGTNNLQSQDNQASHFMIASSDGNPLIFWTFSGSAGSPKLAISHCDDPSCGGTVTVTTPGVLTSFNESDSQAARLADGSVVFTATNQGSIRLIRCSSATPACSSFTASSVIVSTGKFRAFSSVVVKQPGDIPVVLWTGFDTTSNAGFYVCGNTSCTGGTPTATTMTMPYAMSGTRYPHVTAAINQDGDVVGLTGSSDVGYMFFSRVLISSAIYNGTDVGSPSARPANGYFAGSLNASSLNLTGSYPLGKLSATGTAVIGDGSSGDKLQVTLGDNDPTAMTLSEGTIRYMTMSTVNGSESITFSKPVTFAAGGTLADIQVLSGSGTWTKPAGAKRVLLYAVGGGAGGASGRKGASASNRGGGGGGGAGAIAVRYVPASVLGATETYSVAVSVAGGASQTANSTDGIDGSNGQSTTFGTSTAFIVARGGTKGVKGTVLAGTGGLAGAGQEVGGAGADGSLGTGPTPGPSVPNYAPTGGGGGAGLGVADGFSAGGGSGGNDWFPTPGSGGVTQGEGGASGSVAPTGAPMGGAGGGGGASSSIGNAGSGAAGSLYGAGGGGGGASLNAVGNSGAGGAGAAGVLIVVTEF